MTTYADLQQALRGLGEGRWVSRSEGSLIWPEDLDIGVEIAWGQPGQVSWLAPLAALAQPIEAHVTHRGRSMLTLPGHVVWPGWHDVDTDPHRHGAPHVVPALDEQARLPRWQARTLTTALSWLHGIEALPLDELAETLEVDILEDDTLVSVGRSPHPWADEWLAGEGF